MRGWDRVRKGRRRGEGRVVKEPSHFGLRARGRPFTLRPRIRGASAGTRAEERHDWTWAFEGSPWLHCGDETLGGRGEAGNPIRRPVSHGERAGDHQRGGG